MVGKIPPLVSSKCLKDSFNLIGKNFKLLDASWNFKNTGRTDYLSKHIPGAIFYDQSKCVTPIPTIVRTLPDPECHQKQLRSLGVSANSHLVVYARGDLFVAARAWWTIRAMGHPNVSVLDGGLEHWEAEGGKSEAGDTLYDGPEGDFNVKMNNSIIKTFDQMVNMAKNGGEQLLDVREEENFTGEGPEPSDKTIGALKSANFPIPDNMKRGHISGAVNVPIDNFKISGGRLKSKEELQEIFEKSGIDTQRPLTAMCYNGLNACVPALGAAWLGKEDVAVYYGSWTEYGQIADQSLVE